MPRDAKKHSQNKFLRAFVELKIVQKACDAVKLGRSTYQCWMKNDPEFQAKMESLEAAIDDQALEIFYKKVGLLKMTDEDKANNLHKWADNNLIVQMIKRMSRFKESTVVNQTVMNLPVVGLDGGDLAKLVAPDGGSAIDVQGETTVVPRGLTFKDTDKKVKELLNGKDPLAS